MNHFAIATKVWNQAVKGNNRLILENCSKDDIVISVRDNGWKNVKQATDGMNAVVIQCLEFRKIQARKNNLN